MREANVKGDGALTQVIGDVLWVVVCMCVGGRQDLPGLWSSNGSVHKEGDDRLQAVHILVWLEAVPTHTWGSAG